MTSPFTPDIMLIDMNGLGYASMYIPALSRLSFNGLQTGGAHGAMASLFVAMTRNPKAMPVVLWDRHAKWRSDLYPDYKGNRSNTPEKIAIRESYKSQVPIIQQLLTALGIPQVSCGYAEADDLAGVICREIDPSWNIEMVSRDTDWWQAIDDHVVWYSPGSKNHINKTVLADPNNDLECHFLSTHEYLQAKALAGDTSDCIPGIEKVGLKTAVKIMREHGGTIEQFWHAVDSGAHTPKGVAATRLANAESRAIFARNMKLMDWRQAPVIQRDLLSLTAGVPDLPQALEISQDYGLAKTLTHAKEILKPWGQDGWGNALWAVDAALNSNLCQSVVKRQKGNQ